MKKTIQKILFTALTLLLTACATPGNYQQMLVQWHGAHVQDLTRHWGPPTVVIPLSNGNANYTYVRHQLYTAPAPLASSMNYMNVDGTPIYASGFNGGVIGQTISLFCNTAFEVDPQGIIVNSQFQGNGCVANTISRWIR